MLFASDGLNPVRGLNPRNYFVRAFNRSGAAVEKGDLVMFDFARTQSETDSDTPGDDGSIFANFIAPTTAGLGYGKFGIVVDDTIADNAEGQIQVQGVIDEAYIIMASGNLTRGIPLVAINGSHDLDGVTAVGERFLAISMDTATTPTTHVRKKVLFDGINGFGVNAGS